MTDTNQDKTIGDRIKRRREELRLSQGQLAAASGVTAATIGNVEAGIRKKPRELNAIAAALKLHPRWLEKRQGPRELGAANVAAPVNALTEHMAALEIALAALAPILQSTGREVLQKWARGELDARRAARETPFRFPHHLDPDAGNANREAGRDVANRENFSTVNNRLRSGNQCHECGRLVAAVSMQF